jgi:hypothetical protein
MHCDIKHCHLETCPPSVAHDVSRYFSILEGEKIYKTNSVMIMIGFVSYSNPHIVKL